MTGIYTITSPTNKVYVGQSWSIEGRQEDYRKINCKSQTKIYNSIKKYGWEAHKFEVALELRDDISQDTLDCWEEYFYELYKSQDYQMMNIRLPGSRGKLSEETKLKISQNSKQFSGEKHPMFGRKHTEEAKRKMGDSKRGKKQTREVINKRLESSRYYHDSLRGVPLSEEHRVKLSKSAVGRKATHKIMVLNIDTGIYYDTALSASESYSKYQYSTFYSMIKGNRKNKTPFILV